MNPRISLAASILVAACLTSCGGSPGTTEPAAPTTVASNPSSSGDPAGHVDGSTSSPETTSTSSPSSVDDLEPLLDGIAMIELIGPPTTVSDVAPLFEWTEVAGAISYRLVVLGPAGPTWAWQGTETSIRLGGLGDDAGDGFPTPLLADGSTWSVVALDADGSVMAISDARPIHRA